MLDCRKTFGLCPVKMSNYVNVLGMSKEDAVYELEAANKKYRVVYDNGKSLIVSHETVTNRVDLYLDRGVVFRQEGGNYID